ncbi:MAG: chromate efflux transporter [Dehalococcoidia bacterium]
MPSATRRWEVLRVFVLLGMTSFGGPVAHLGYFRTEVVDRRGWLDDEAYADLVALCQVLPGPASSQVAMALGIIRAGPLGGLLAWLGFTLPSVAALLIFALVVTEVEPTGAFGGALHGLKVVAVAVVAQAAWGMLRTLAPDPARATFAVAAAVVALIWPAVLAQVAIIAVAGLAGWLLLPAEAVRVRTTLAIPIGRRVAIASLGLFVGLLVALPLLRVTTGSPAIALVDAFFRSGALVFGGGHVVLPLLDAEVVAPGWLTEAQFLAGYGAAQAAPGPLFSIAAYLGAVRAEPPNGLAGGLLALGAIYLPAVLLVAGAVPVWGLVRTHPAVRRALRGINAAVVGIVLASLYSPLFTSAILSPSDAGIALIALLLLAGWRLPPWIVVLVCACAGAVYSR